VKQSNIGGIFEKLLQMIAKNCSGDDIRRRSLRRDQYSAIKVRGTVMLFFQHGPNAVGIVDTPVKGAESVFVNANAKGTSHKWTHV
jgi:hypothetical protein